MATPLQLQTTSGNALIGSASPVMRQVQAVQAEQAGYESGDKMAVLGQVFSNALNLGESFLAKMGAKARIQGAVDAAGTQNALEHTDENLGKQNFFLRKAYGEGYVSAALNKELASYTNSLMVDTQDAISQGMSLPDFDALMERRSGEFSEASAKYLGKVGEKEAMGFLGSARTASLATRDGFMRGSAAAATARADEELSNVLDSNNRAFYNSISLGDNQGAFAQIDAGLFSVRGSTHLSADDKAERAKTFLLGVAQQSDDPDLINAVMQRATTVLGPQLGVEIFKGMRAEYDRAGRQQSGAQTISLMDELSRLRDLPPEQQKEAFDMWKGRMTGLNQNGIISDGTMVSLYKQSQQVDDKVQNAYILTTGLQTAAAPAQIAGATGWDSAKAYNEIYKTFPDTAEGNSSLLKYGMDTKDAAVTNEAFKRIGNNVANFLNTVDLTALKDGNLSEDSVKQLNMFQGVYNTSNAFGKSAILNQLPAELKGVVHHAFAQNPDNVSNTLMDDLRRMSELQSGGQTNITAPAAIKDGSWNSGYFDFGKDNDMLAAQGANEAARSFQYLKEQGRLSHDDEINTKMVQADAESRRFTLELSQGSVNAFVPTGKQLSDYTRGFKGTPEEFAKSMATTVDQVTGMFQNVRGVDVQMGVAGFDSGDAVLNITLEDGRVQRATLSMDNVAALATSTRDDTLRKQVAKGRDLAGLTPVTYTRQVGNKYTVVNTNVSGKNGANVAPKTFGKAMSHLMQYEGFVPEGKTMADGSRTVGFCRHQNSGKDMPAKINSEAEGVQMLREDIESTYLPQARRVAKKAGMTLEGDALVLALDMTYHGWDDFAPVATALQEFKDTPMTAPDKFAVIGAMTNTKAFKQAGDGKRHSARQKEMLQLLHNTMDNMYLRNFQ